MRKILKRIAEGALLQGGPAALSRRRWRRGVLVLGYHNVLPASVKESGADRSLHLPQSTFAQQLDHLGKVCEVVQLADLLAGRCPTGKPLAAITFDDGYLGALTAGVEELEKRNLPATFFVVPGCLDGHAFWWDRFVEADGRPLAPETRAFLMERLAGEEAAVEDWAKTRLREVPVPDAARTSGIKEFRSAASNTGIGFGAHTWTHPNLARLTGAALDRELREPLSWISNNLGSPSRALAFPYGRYSETVTSRLTSAGYQAGLAIEGGWFRAGPPLAQVLPRLNVSSGLSPSGFALRLAGLLQ